MAPTARRLLLALSALGVAFLVGNALRGGASPDGAATTAPPAPATQRRPAGTAGEAASAILPVADVQLELLNQSRAESGETDRNPFRFRERPAPPPRPVAPRQPVPTAPPVPQGPPPPPAITLRLIGLLNAPTQAGRVAVLSDGSGNVFNGREGDIIEGRYRLLKIGTDSAERAYADGRGRQVIRLVG